MLHSTRSGQRPRPPQRSGVSRFPPPGLPSGPAPTRPLFLRAARFYTPAMPGWVAARSRYFWLSLAIGLASAVVASTTFTDPWPAAGGGLAFVVIVVTALVRGLIALGHAFVQGWREPQVPRAH